MIKLINISSAFKKRPLRLGADFSIFSGVVFQEVACICLYPSDTKGA